MSEVIIHDKTFVPFLTAEEIDREVKRIAKEIKRDIGDREPLILTVLNGAFMFSADLLKYITNPLHLAFIQLSSYHGMESTGKVTEVLGIGSEVKDRAVVIIEDIVDSGTTIDFLVDKVTKLGASDVRVCTLLFKPSSYKGKSKIDYIGFEIPPAFVVGYGLDYDGLGRNLDAIWQLKTENHMINLVLFGPPGAGKGTQAAHLVDKFGLIHLSTGDIFRRNIKGETELGKLAKEYMDKGSLVPDEVTIAMLEAEVNRHAGAKGFIFDGFPRTVKQAEALDKFLQSKGTEVTRMLALDVPEYILKDRLKGRALESGRTDDADPAIIQRRIEVYRRETAPVADYYRSQNKYTAVNGVGSIEEISQRLFEVVEG